MPGSGTDRTKEWLTGGPWIILVEPQMGENIGSVARVMGNFGLSKLRIVKPRDGWPNIAAKRSASGADRILDEAQIFDTVEAAVADCSFVVASTARQHAQAKEVLGPEENALRVGQKIAGGENVGILFGRERSGLESEEVGLADIVVTMPVNPAFASLNLAQAVAIVGYEYFKLQTQGATPFTAPERSPAASKQQLYSFFNTLETELERVEFFRPPEKRSTMLINLRNIFNRMTLSQQDVRTLHGVVMALVEGRRGPARGGVLDGQEAEVLRTLLAEHAAGRVPSERGPVRGLARLLRRNPTESERLLWTSLTNDRRFAGRGFKRQVPVGPHIADFVSFPLRSVISLIPADEGEEAARVRLARNEWLTEHRYKIVEIPAAAVDADVKGLLDRLDAECAQSEKA
ncbi:MAG TPA: TrmJ/YjtD family RNA methyltransferase [Xanthobacteraceae bacterium]|nr:TrmJ/YjtD family RNA methyltransferase [Xanthobacteraceae bacterium]